MKIQSQGCFIPAPGTGEVSKVRVGSAVPSPDMAWSSSQAGKCAPEGWGVG